MLRNTPCPAVPAYTIVDRYPNCAESAGIGYGKGGKPTIAEATAFTPGLSGPVLVHTLIPARTTGAYVTLNANTTMSTASPRQRGLRDTCWWFDLHVCIRDLLFGQEV